MLFEIKSLIRICLLIPLATILIVLACTKEEELLKAKVDTLPAKIVGDSVYLNGNVNSLGSAKPESLGFLIGRSSSSDINNSEVVVFDTNVSVGAFSVPVLNDFEKDEVYYVRAFIKDATETIYGNQVNFIGKGKIAFRIDDFMPKKGFDGEFVKIFGKKFGTNRGDIKVLFGSKEAEIVSLNDERLVVRAPPYEFTGSCKIIIIKKGNPFVSSEDFFFLDGPQIANFSPNRGSGKIKITINGNGFSEHPWRNIVMVGEAEAEVLEASKENILILVNTQNIRKGRYTISITSDEKKTFSESYFEVESPWSEVKNISTGVSEATVFNIHNKLYLCTGTTNGLGTSDVADAVFEYDVKTDHWTQKAHFPGGDRVDAVGFSIGEKGYLATGATSSLNGENKSDLWEYDPISDIWSRKADLPGGARKGAIAFSHKGKGYVGLGTAAFGWIKRQDFWQYDPKEDKWLRLPDFEGNGRIDSQIAILGDKLYVIGGRDPNTSFDPDIWEFDLVNLKWTLIGVLDISPIPPIASFYYENKCFLIVYKPYLSSLGELLLVEFDPAKNLIVNELPVFPGMMRLFGSFSIAVNGNLFFGAGGTKKLLLNDIWNYPISKDE